MAFIPTSGCVRTDIQWLQQDQQIHNVLWFKREANWTQAEREALNDAIVTWWDTAAKGDWASTFGLMMVTSVNQEAANAPSSQRIVSPLIMGGTTPGVVPNHTACVATLRTGLRGRSFRGRVYVAGMPGTALSDRIQFTSAWIVNVITALTALKTAVEALGALWVVVSHFANKAPRASGLVTPVTAISVDTYIDSQRRRLGLRGV